MTPRLVAILVGLMAMSPGCQSVHHAYTGEPRPLSDVAVLEVAEGRAVQLNGEKIFATELRLPPGDYGVAATFRLSGDELGEGVSDDSSFKLRCQFRLSARAGHLYRLEMEEPSRQGRRGSRTRYTHSARLLNLTKNQVIARVTACGWQ